MNRFLRPLPACALLALAATAPRAAGELNFALDVPTTIGATTYPPNQTVNGYNPLATWSYAVNAAGPGSGLTAGVRIDALALRTDGVYLFSVDAPATIGAVNAHPADILSYNGSVYAKVFDHATDLGLGEGADITALAFDGFYYFAALDTPTPVNKTGGGTIAYDPRQVLRIDATGAAPTYSLAFDGTAGATALPAGTVIAGYERFFSTGDSLISLDVPATLGPVTSQPGDVLRYNGLAWSLYYRDTAVFPNPPPNRLGDFALPLTPGESDLLRLAKNGGNLNLSWGAIACTNVTTRDYAVYQGTLGSWYSHNTAATCATGGVTAAVVTPPAGNVYYLVVPNNGAFEGDYGHDSTGFPLPVSSAACRPDLVQLLTCS